MHKPFEYSTLIERIARIYKNRQSAYKNQIMNGVQYSQEPSDLEAQVTEIIHRIGVPAHIKGYQYLRTAIMMTIEDNDLIYKCGYKGSLSVRSEKVSDNIFKS